MQCILLYARQIRCQDRRWDLTILIIVLQKGGELGDTYASECKAVEAIKHATYDACMNTLV
jgi:hypothetical protein